MTRGSVIAPSSTATSGNTSCTLNTNGARRVRANCIAPGLIKTDFAKALWSDPKLLKHRVKDSPLNRIGEPDEIAGAAVFLASKASGFMTGQTMVIDGGVTAGVPPSALE